MSTKTNANTNASLWEIVQKLLEIKGVKIASWEDVPGYFIFPSKKKLEIVHFQVKGCPGWRFGIWFNQNPGEALVMFAQHIDWINKFKPGQTCLETVVKYDKTEKGNAKKIKIDEDGWPSLVGDFCNFLDIANIVNFIQKNPCYAYVVGNHGYLFCQNILRSYLKDKWFYFWDDLRENHLRYIVPMMKTWLFAVKSYFFHWDVSWFHVYNADKETGFRSYPATGAIRFGCRQKKGEDEFEYFKRCASLAEKMSAETNYSEIFPMKTKTEEFPEEYFDRWFSEED